MSREQLSSILLARLDVGFQFGGMLEVVPNRLIHAGQLQAGEIESDFLRRCAALERSYQNI